MKIKLEAVTVLKLILIFTIIPLLELFILIQISNYLGIIFTISLVAITGLTGAYLTKKQGTSVLTKIRKAIAEGMMPADSLIDGFLILIGGIMLITPGIMTDIGGFSCIIPFTRKIVKKLTVKQFNNLIKTGRFQFSTPDDDNQEDRVVNIVKDKKEEGKKDIKK